MKTSAAMDEAERFWSKVNKEGPVPAHRPDLGPCHLWLAGTDADGYGKFSVGNKPMLAHRYAYIRKYGQPPTDTLDHLCFVHACVNADHLEPIGRGENVRRHFARQTHFRCGHPRSIENSAPSGAGRLRCRTCKRAHDRTGRPNGRPRGSMSASRPPAPARQDNTARVLEPPPHPRPQERS